MSEQKDSIPSYRRILAPYDGSEMSDKALKHASYIAKMTDAEVVIMQVMEVDYIPPSALLGYIRPGDDLFEAKERLRASFETGAKQKLEEKAKELKITGISKVSYKIKSGKPSDEIVHESEEGMYDLIVMASSRISSSIRVLGSNARRVIDSTRKPVLLIHE